MMVFDQLMKVQKHEIGTHMRMQALGLKEGFCYLQEVMENEDKLVLVFEFCPQGQLMKWDPKQLSFTSYTGQ